MTNRETYFEDKERLQRLREAMRSDGLDVFICALPQNVLLLTGYWPVIGNSIGIVTREGEVAIIAPEDEGELAGHSWADEIQTFEGASLNTLEGIQPRVCDRLQRLKTLAGCCAGTSIGFEGGASFHPSGYASTFVYGMGMRQLLGEAFPRVTIRDATSLFARLRSTLTAHELDNVRQACGIAQGAFLDLAGDIGRGMREFEIAARLRSKLSTGAAGYVRCDGFAYCMSGPNAALAYAAFQQSGGRVTGPGDWVLAHCNSYLGGFWTDITRTFVDGEPDDEQRVVMETVLEASRNAIAAIRPGIRAGEVDRAARRVLEANGFGPQFKHATGHGVGFAAVDHNAFPRIHPLSDDLLETGMVFNVEPAVYIAGRGGMRHCSMVAVTAGGAEVLTPFLEKRETLIAVPQAASRPVP